MGAPGGAPSASPASANGGTAAALAPEAGPAGRTAPASLEEVLRVAAENRPAHRVEGGDDPG